MKLLFTFWEKYTEVPTKSRLFIENNSNVLYFNKGEYYAREGQYKPFWNFVSEGILGGHSHDREGRKTIHCITQANGYFTGSLHLHSNTPYRRTIQFFRRGRIIQVPLEKMRYAQKTDPAINELMQVLKQHKINQQQLLIKILSQKDTTQRYFTFMDEMKEIAEQLTAAQIMAYIQIRSTSYKSARKKYLKRKL